MLSWSFNFAHEGRQVDENVDLWNQNENHFVNHPSVLSSANQVTWNSHSIPTTRGQSTLFVARSDETIVGKKHRRSPEVPKPYRYLLLRFLTLWDNKIKKYSPFSLTASFTAGVQEQKGLGLLPQQALMIFRPILQAENQGFMIYSHKRLWAIPKNGESSPDPGVWLKSRPIRLGLRTSCTRIERWKLNLALWVVGPSGGSATLTLMRSFSYYHGHQVLCHQAVWIS